VARPHATFQLLVESIPAGERAALLQMSIGALPAAGRLAAITHPSVYPSIYSIPSTHPQASLFAIMAIGNPHCERLFPMALSAFALT